jgi:biopolymer transport protein ExbD
MAMWDETALEDEDASPLPRREFKEDSELDITPMIDVTFLLLIFFIVSSVPDVQRALELPTARHGVGVSILTSIVITVADRGAPGRARIYLGDGKVGAPLADDPKQQEAAIRAALERGFSEGKKTLLIKAERGVLHRDVARVAQLASTVEGLQLNLAVMEID